MRPDWQIFYKIMACNCQKYQVHASSGQIKKEGFLNAMLGPGPDTKAIIETSGKHEWVCGLMVPIHFLVLVVTLW